MKIALLTTDNREHHRRYDLPDPYFGPAPEALLQGLSTLSDLEVHVISCTQRSMQSPDKLADNIWFHSLKVPKFGWLRTGYQGCIRATRRFLRGLRPDIVHGQGTERDCAISAVFCGFPNVVTIHGNMRSIARTIHARPLSYQGCMAMLERFTLRRTAGVFCNSAYTESAVRKDARKTWRVPNAIRREFFEFPVATKLATAKPKLVNIGVISSRKRQVEILALAEQLHQEGALFELQFVGAADPNDRYAKIFLKQIALAEEAGYARYLGALELSDLIAALDAASGLIHAPSEEAFGLVVAEALTRNLKFFGTNVGGIREIAAGVEGAEVFPVDDRNGLKNSIRRWTDNESPRPASAKVVMRERYEPCVIARRHVEIYHEVLNNRS